MVINIFYRKIRWRGACCAVYCNLQLGARAIFGSFIARQQACLLERNRWVNTVGVCMCVWLLIVHTKRRQPYPHRLARDPFLCCWQCSDTHPPKPSLSFVVPALSSISHCHCILDITQYPRTLFFIGEQEGEKESRGLYKRKNDCVSCWCGSFTWSLD